MRKSSLVIIQDYFIVIIDYLVIEVNFSFELLYFHLAIFLVFNVFNSERMDFINYISISS